jgi:ferredoxin
MLDILTDICEGRGSAADLALLNDLSEAVQKGSLCALGQTAPNPVRSTLGYFKEEYEKHVLDRKCTAGVCSRLFHYEIDPELCNGCGLCIRNCSSEAIAGEKKQSHIINQEKCTKCGICYNSCKFDAVAII